MSAPDRIWIDGAVNANVWAEQKTDCTLSGVAAYGYVRADLCAALEDVRSEYNEFRQESAERERDFALKMGKLEARAEAAEAELTQRKTDNMRWRHEATSRTNELITERDALKAELAEAVRRLSARERESLSRIAAPWAHWNTRADLCDPTQDERVKSLVKAAQAQLDYMDMCNDSGDLERNLRAALRALEQGEE